MEPVLLTVLLLAAPACRGAAPDLLYPYGPPTGDTALQRADDTASQGVALAVPIRYFSETYDLIFVSNNGLVSFVNPLPEYHSVQFPLEYLVVAPLYSNVDTRLEGTVWYRETRDEVLLARAAERVRRLYPGHGHFQPAALFIATWDHVGYPNSTTEVNTFQVAFSTDGDESFVELLYLDGGLQWIQTWGEGYAIPDAKPQAGLVSHDGRLFTLRGSGTDQIRNLDKWTNGDTPGIFTFRIGQIGENENVEQPSSYFGNEDEIEPLTCQMGITRCHSKANCYDSSLGFCCECKENYYGNGRNCLSQHGIVRANGKIRLNVNGISSAEPYLQAYIIPRDGASYTAVSNVPQPLGYELQLLEGLGSLVGWLFAKPIGDGLNGFQLTGGIFNYSADIAFDTGHRLFVKQRYHGLDIFDQLKMDAEISGVLPSIPPKANLVLPDFQEQFTVTEPGVLRSQAQHAISVEGTDEVHRFTKVQTVQYGESCRERGLEATSLRLKSARHTLQYRPEENILRFSSFNKVSRNVEGEDPCLEGQVKCVANSSCLVDGDSFKCVCNRGFQSLYSESSEHFGCHDVNECEEESAKCDANAICVNEIGTYHCQCKLGFQGDGITCTPMQTDVDSTRSCENDLSLCTVRNGYCEDPNDISSCKCDEGFRGVFDYDGRFECEDIDECHEVQPCHQNAECYNADGGFNCRCRHGFIGDGLTCEYPVQVDNCNGIECSAGAHCEDDYNGPKCVCDSGYTGTPPNCQSFDLGDCSWDEDCHEHARCEYHNGVRQSQCVCSEGYEGDGIHCFPLGRSPDRIVKTCLNGNCWCPPNYFEHDNFCSKTPSASPRPCNVENTCHEHAQCLYLAHAREYQCKCNPGYEGNGHECTEMEVSCAVVSICHENATCTFHETTGKDICICNEGFQGDGSICYALDECVSSEDCGRNAGCVYNREKAAQVCICPPDYIKDENGDCVENNIDWSRCGRCHEWAECVESLGDSWCRCREGLQGDGVSDCHQADQQQCLACSPYAQCTYDLVHRKYTCNCLQDYEGDGYECSRKRDCYNEPDMCSEFATCISTDHDIQCRCNQGYIGNGTFCRERPVHQGGFILLNQGRSTIQLPFHPTPANRGRPIHLHNDQVPIGIAIDCVEGRVFWSDISKKTIQSSNYDGTDMQDFLIDDIESSEGLTVDWVNRAIYWTDSGLDTISKADLETKEKTVIVSDNLVNPRGIAVHPWKRKVYWSDWDRRDPKIESANLDGRGRAVLLKGSHVKLPNSLAIDWQTDELCWADAGTFSIECLKLSSGMRRTAVRECKYPFGLTITPEKYYWTDWVTFKIENADKNGRHQEPLKLLLGGDDKLYGIAAVTDSCP